MNARDLIKAKAKNLLLERKLKIEKGNILALRRNLINELRENEKRLNEIKMLEKFLKSEKVRYEIDNINF